LDCEGGKDKAMVKAVLMAAVAPGHAMGQGVATLLEQLDRHYLAPDGSLATKSAYLDLVQAREEMARERLRYLEGVVCFPTLTFLILFFSLPLWEARFVV
jgi:hypothetical protein